MFKKPLFWVIVVLAWVWWETSWMWGTYYDATVPQRMSEMSAQGMRTTDAETTVAVELLSGWAVVLLVIIVLLLIAKKLLSSGGHH